MDLRASLLSSRGSGESYQGTALRHGDWPHQLQRLLGQSVPGTDDGCSLCADAGTTPGLGGHSFRSGASLNSAGTLSENWRSGGRFGASHRTALTLDLSLSRKFLPSGPEFGGSKRVGLPLLQTEARSCLTP